MQHVPPAELTRKLPLVVALLACLVDAKAADNNANPSKPTESKASSKDTLLPTISVSADKEVGEAAMPTAGDDSVMYKVTKSFAATKTNTPLIETPIAVQVVPRAVMEDQKVNSVKGALENVSGVRPQPSLGSGIGFKIRGFNNNNIFRNGLMSSEAFFGDLDTGNIQSVEVVKGPAQLYGRTEPGGMINLSTKRALDTPYYSLEQQFGMYSLYRTEWDAGGPITDDKSLQYRFSGAYQSNNSFRDFVSADRFVINPSITWRPTDSTDFTLDVEGVRKVANADFGIPVIGRRPANIPITRNLGDPNTPEGTNEGVKIGTEFNHRFNDDWAIHHRFLTSLVDSSTTFVNPAPAFNAAQSFNELTGLMKRNIFSQASEQEHYAMNLDLTGKFEFGRTKHDLLFGFDYYRTHNKYQVNGIWRTANPALNIDIYNPAPSYGIPESSFAAARLASETFGNDVNGRGNRAQIYNSWYGAYFQDHMTISDKFHVMWGGRYDWLEFGRGNGASFEAAEAKMEGLIYKDDGFSPRVGVLYEILPQLSIYGNWTKSIGANNAPSADGRKFDPQIGEQFEGGFKAQLFDDRLLATVAYYNLTKDNILVSDLSTPDDPFDKIANKQRSQGVELDVTGQLSDYVSLIGSYAFTDARVIADNGGTTAGNRLNNVPEHSGSVWAKYDVNGYAAQEGFSFGVGGVAVGQREVDNANTAEMPGYVRLDAMLAYKQKIGDSRLTASFNLKNILDKDYFESTDPDSNVAPRLGVYPGAPLTAVGSIRLEY